MKYFRDENGSMTLWGIMALAFITACVIWLVEAGRIITVKGELQTAADAASLAGAMTAEKKVICDVTDEYEAGNVTAVINKETADAAAEKLLSANTKLPVNEWDSAVDGTKYTVNIRNVEVESSLASFIGKPITISVTSDAWATK